MSVGEPIDPLVALIKWLLSSARKVEVETIYHEDDQDIPNEVEITIDGDTLKLRLRRGEFNESDWIKIHKTIEETLKELFLKITEFIAKRVMLRFQLNVKIPDLPKVIVDEKDRVILDISGIQFEVKDPKPIEVKKYKSGSNIHIKYTIIFSIAYTLERIRE